MKKIILSILSTVIVSAVIGVNTILNNPPVDQAKEQLKQETKIEKVDEKIDTSKKAEKEEIKQQEIVEEKQEIVEEKTPKTEKSVKKETKSKSTEKPSSSVSNAPKQETPTKQESNKVNNATNPKPSQNTQQTNQTNSNTKSNNSGQKSTVSTTFYDSITGGKKEFSSESEAFARGTQIQNNELDYVLDWNETHPDNQIQPDINYFRVYPSVVDENGKYWYYLHFFCRSGEGNDASLKSKF